MYRRPRRPTREKLTPAMQFEAFKRQFLAYPEGPARCRVCGGTVEEHINYRCRNVPATTGIPKV